MGNLITVFQNQTAFKITGGGGASFIANQIQGITGTSTANNFGITFTLSGNNSVESNLFGGLDTAVTMDAGSQAIFVGGNNVYSGIGTNVSNASASCFVGYQKLAADIYLGSVLFAQNSTGTTFIRNGDASGFAFITTSVLNAIRNTTTVIQSPDGLTTFAQIDADGFLTTLNLRSSTKVTVDPCAVSALPAAATSVGGRATVNNATQTLTAGIGAIVAGGGGNIVPVFCDGTNWRIG
jgi:hypothetical protein